MVVPVRRISFACAAVFEEVGEAEKRMANASFRPIQKNGALGQSDQVVGIQIQIAHGVWNLFPLQGEQGVTCIRFER
jgi:hypothetical protein